MIMGKESGKSFVDDLVKNRGYTQQEANDMLANLYYQDLKDGLAITSLPIFKKAISKNKK